MVATPWRDTLLLKIQEHLNRKVQMGLESRAAIEEGWRVQDQGGMDGSRIPLGLCLLKPM